MTTLIERNENGDPVISNRLDGAVIEQAFDERANLLSAADGFNDLTKGYAYDPAYNLAPFVTDPLSRTTTFHRDNDTVGIADQLGQRIGYRYAAAGDPRPRQDTRKRRRPCLGFVGGSIVNYR
ncbi:MAG: hypothetical protein ABFS02_11555 [Pseudomonadota bacterium]